MKSRQVRPIQERFNQHDPAIQYGENERHGAQYSGLDQGVNGSVMHVSIEDDAVSMESVSALAVLASTGPPVLFRQVRTGLNSRPFTLLKFRTMADAVDASRELVREQMEGAWDLDIPLVVDISVGNNWAEAHG